MRQQNHIAQNICQATRTGETDPVAEPGRPFLRLARRHRHDPHHRHLHGHRTDRPFGLYPVARDGRRRQADGPADYLVHAARVRVHAGDDFTADLSRDAAALWPPIEGAVTAALLGRPNRP